MDLAQTLGQLGLETLFDPVRSNLTNFIEEESQGSERVTFNRYFVNLLDKIEIIYEL